MPQGQTSKEVRRLIAMAKKQGWTVVQTSNNHLKFTSPTGAAVTVTRQPTPGTLKAICNDLIAAGFDPDADKKPTPVKTAMSDAMARAEERRQYHERRVTPQECGEGRPEVQAVQEKIVVVNPPKTVVEEVTRVEKVEIHVANPAPAQYHTLSEARANGMKFSDEVERFFTNELVCRVDGTEILSTGGLGPHLQMHRRQMENMTPALAAMMVLEAIQRPAPVDDRIEKIAEILKTKAGFDALAAIAKVVGL